MIFDKEKFEENGFQVINDIFSKKEIQQILDFLEAEKVEKAFGIRCFLKIHPELNALIFNEKLISIIRSISRDAQIIKSIYFDKPPNANWIVNWHQDLTINVEGKTEKEHFKNWRFLKNRTVVQPPLEILKNIFTIRIHLDKCTQKNGALQVVSDSHKNGVVNLTDKISDLNSIKKVCEVDNGGILIMKPLLFHSSRRTENQKNRRVIHIEFSDTILPKGMKWLELQKI